MISFVKNPCHPHLLADFKRGFVRMFSPQIFADHPMLILSCVALLLLSLLPFLPTAPRGKMLIGTLLFALIVPAIFVLIRTARSPEPINPYAHYGYRIFYTFLPLPLTIVLFATLAFCKPQDKQPWLYGFMIIAVLAFSQIAWNFLATAQWRRYLDVFQETLMTQKGFIPYERSGMTPDDLRKRGMTNMSWGWTEPGLSILLAPGGKIRTVIEANPCSPWFPFDPHDPSHRPDLSSYGFTYEIEK